MCNILHFKGFIQEVQYYAYLAKHLPVTPWNHFDVNTVSPSGLIEFQDGTRIAYSRWVSPKRTRSYPFARIYHTYNSSPKITIIPILKDEGKDGDRDRIQYSTFSWMSLLDTYIVLAYYNKATPKFKSGKQKITDQKFDNLFVKSQIEKIKMYAKSASDWNQELLQAKSSGSHFTTIFKTALNQYDEISRETKVPMHSRRGIDRYIQNIQKDFSKFQEISLKGSQAASQREAATTHKYEYLIGSHKATFEITDYLGGIYHLTPDEIILDKTEYIIQESKNASKGNMPSFDDILDGLFKLILFSNLDGLTLNNKPVSFSTCLNLTGTKIKGVLALPATQGEITIFIRDNPSLQSKLDLIKKLNKESDKNNKLQVKITGNT